VVSIIDLADKVAEKLKDGQKFHMAAREVLRENDLDDWDYYFPAIGKELGKRKKKKRKRTAKKEVYNWRELREEVRRLQTIEEAEIATRIRGDHLLSDP
jgi:hypothetical protein